jgi:hypothetical protein
MFGCLLLLFFYGLISLKDLYILKVENEFARVQKTTKTP